MESYQVHTAFYGGQQFCQFFCVAWHIVQSAKDNILKAQTALVCPVVLLQQGQKLCQAVGILCRHHLQAFCREGVVQADGQVTVALLQKACQTFAYAHCRYCDALRTPGIAVVGS